MFSLSGYVTPCLNFISLGASFAASLNQRVTNAILRSAKLPAPTPFSGLLDSRLRKSSATPLPYIEDVNIIGMSSDTVNSARNKDAISFSESNLPTEPSKRVDAGVSYCSIATSLSS